MNPQFQFYNIERIAISRGEIGWIDECFSIDNNLRLMENYENAIKLLDLKDQW